MQRKMQCNLFIKSKFHAEKKNYRELPAHGKLTLLLLKGRGLTTHTHAQKPSEKEMKIKGLPFLSSRQARVRAVIVARKWRPTLAAAHTPSSNLSLLTPRTTPRKVRRATGFHKPSNGLYCNTSGLEPLPPHTLLTLQQLRSLSDNPVPFLRSPASFSIRLPHSITRAPLEHVHLTLTFSLPSAFPLERFQRTSAPDRVPPFSFRSRTFPTSAFPHERLAARPLSSAPALNVPDPEARGAGPPFPIGRAKRRRVWSDPGIAHVGRPCSLKLRGLGRRFCRPFGVALQQEEEEVEIEAMVGGWRKMAAV